MLFTAAHALSFKETGGKSLRQILLMIPCALMFCGCVDNPGATDPWDAAYRGSTRELRHWIQAGGDVNVRNESGYTLLDTAVGPGGGTALVKLLLSEGTDPNICPDGGRSPLVNAAGWGDYKKVKLLVEAGADVNYRDSSGFSAYDVALRTSELEIADYLAARMDPPPPKRAGAPKESTGRKSWCWQ